jgi:hypothetical protein
MVQVYEKCIIARSASSLNFEVLLDMTKHASIAVYKCTFSVLQVK